VATGQIVAAADRNKCGSPWERLLFAFGSDCLGCQVSGTNLTARQMTASKSRHSTHHGSRSAMPHRSVEVWDAGVGPQGPVGGRRRLKIPVVRESTCGGQVSSQQSAGPSELDSSRQSEGQTSHSALLMVSRSPALCFVSPVARLRSPC
jgi:hypothetical protein